MSADGPMGDLDERIEMDMMHFFMNMKKSEGITFVLVTHNTDIAKHTKTQLKMQNGPIRNQ